MVKEQKIIWMEKESRHENDAPIKISCQKNGKYSDTISRGALKFRTGAQIALPFFARFETLEEAQEYCEKKIEPFKYLGKTICIIWDSVEGKKLLKTMVLSKNALSYLIIRDLYASDGFVPILNIIFYWLLYVVSFSVALFTIQKRMFNSNLISLILFTTIGIGMASYMAFQAHHTYKWRVNFRADNKAGVLSESHRRGGEEYYVKMLIRHRILRQLMEKGDKKIIAANGDMNNIKDTPFTHRLDLLMGTSAQQSEITAFGTLDDVD